MARSRNSLDKRKVSPKKANGLGKGSAKGPPTKSASMQVVVRVRPPSEKELEAQARRIIAVVNDQGLVFDPNEPEDLFFYRGSKQMNRDITKRKNKNAEFVFDRVFDETASNKDVYEYSTKEILKALFDGYNCSVFAYGATGSGKTFTMLGNEKNPGIAYQTMVELYQRVHELSEEYDFEIGVSYLEVYNENVRDLLQPGSKHLYLRESASSEVTIPDLTIRKISCADELFSRLTQGNMNRTQHPTDVNAESSRSHAVFQTYIHSRLKKTMQHKLVKLSMIDLAGSEKASATGGRGARFAEGQNINRSLLALGNCINSLAAGNKHVPYRDSKLTRLLKDSLGGNCKTVMIANISPCSNSYEDTHRTLKYAESAKMIKLKLAKNVVPSGFSRMQYDKLVGTLQSENVALKEELSVLKKEVLQLKEKLRPYEEGQSTAAEASFFIKTEPPDSVSDEAGVLPPASESDSAECFVPESEAVVKCDKEVQVFIPVKDLAERKIVSDLRAVFALRKELNKVLASDESNLKRLQWKCYRRLVTTRRLNSLGTDHKELEKREAYMRNSVRATLRQAQEHHNNVYKVWQDLEAHRDREAAVLARAVAANDSTVDTLLAKCQLEATVQNAEAKIKHMEELLNVLYTQGEQDDAAVRTLCSCLKSHHVLLKAYGKVTDAMSREYKNCMKTLEGKVVKFASERDENRDDMAVVSSLLWDNERLWSCADGSLPSPHFDHWLSRMTTLLEEVERNSVRRESIAIGCTPIKLNTTFCKETHDVLESTFVLATTDSESKHEAIQPEPQKPPQQLLQIRPPPSFGFTATVKLEAGVDLSEQNKENRDAIFKKPTPGKQARKQLKYSGSPRPVLAARNTAPTTAASSTTGIRVPLKLKTQTSSTGLKHPTVKVKTPKRNFHPYRGPESVPRIRPPKIQKKESSF